MKGDGSWELGVWSGKFGDGRWEMGVWSLEWEVGGLECSGFVQGIAGLKGLVVGQGVLHEEQGMLNYFIVGIYPYFVKYEKRL